MKNYGLFAGLILSFLALQLIQSQTTNVTLKATFKTSESVNIPNVYVKIYLPDVLHPVDSFFSDEQGSIDQILPFTYSGNTSVRDITANDVITQKLSPTIISSATNSYSIRYNYPLNAELVIADMNGKEYGNNSKLSSGNYVYYLKFYDSRKTTALPFTVIDDMFFQAKLINLNTNMDHKSQTRKSTHSSTSVFYASYTKDGFITKTDTIILTDATVNKSYQFEHAPKPTADFTTQGNLKVGETIIFDASASTGSADEELIYAWDFGNEKKGQQVSLPHLYTTTGDYEVTLTVTGNHGAKSTVTKTITITSDMNPVSHNGKIMGMIYDEDGNGLPQATLYIIENDSSAVANDTGYVSLSGFPTEIPLHLKLSKTGYVAQIVTLEIPEDSKEAYFFTNLKGRNTTITLSDAEFGGEVIGDDGTTINLPIEAFVTEEGSRVTGDVDISITPVDVTTEASSFPGSFEGIRTNGEDAVLLSYGVSEFHFQQGDNELGLAPGKKADIYIPIYTTGATIGQEIPLWSVNEDNGTWIQEGIGTVVAYDDSPTGLAFRAEVGHFSWWNCDDFDEDRKKDGLCWRWECTTAQCVKVKVGCWMSGARRDPAEPEAVYSKRRKLKPKNTEPTTPPVFEVREFVPSKGSSLRFPSSLDVYIEARGFSEHGELLIGRHTVLASDLTDTFSIQLTGVTDIYEHDTVELAINDTLYEFVGSETFKHYKVNIPADKLYLLDLTHGEYPILNGMFFVKNNGNPIKTGDIGYNMPQYIYAETDEIIISVVGETENDSGNIAISWKEIDATTIGLNDSVSGSLKDYTDVNRYTISIDTTALLHARFYTDPGDNPTGHVKFIAPNGDILVDQGLDVTERSFSQVIVKDSVYFFEVTSNKHDPITYHIITKEDIPDAISYGDTIINRLETSDDVDLLRFAGNSGDLVHIKGSRPDYELYGGVFALLDVNGVEIAQGTTTDNYVSEEHEIVYKLTETGTYSIEVYSTQNDTGRYQIILNNPSYSSLAYNDLTELTPDHDKEYFYELDVPEDKITHLSVVAESGGGEYALRNDRSARINPYGNWHYGTYYFGSFTASLEAGRYYLKVENDNANKVFINLLEAKPLSFNEKGLAQLTDTIDIKHLARVYNYSGTIDNGIHALVKSKPGEKVPYGMDLLHFLPDSLEDQFYADNMQLDHYSNDSTILAESAGKLDGDPNDTTRVIVIYADSTGIFDLSLYQTEASDNITVDDDFINYPAAQTSSVIAAGYAINEGGTITLANGEYRSYLTVTITTDDVHMLGQEKDNTHIINVRNNSNNTILEFNSSNGILENLTLAGDQNNYNSIDFYKDNITLSNLHITTFDNHEVTGGEIKSRGDNTVFQNISFDKTMRGINHKANNGLIESCTFSTWYTAIESGNYNNTIKHNIIDVNQSGGGIRITGAGGNHIVDSNNININYTSFGGDYGAIGIDERGSASDNHISYIRGNIINNSSGLYALYGSVDYPPSQLIIENNRVYNTEGSGGKALYLYPARYTGSSSIIVRNNTFEGITPDGAIYLLYPDYVDEDEYLAICNNSFSIDSTLTKNSDDAFVTTWANSGFTDTANVYIVNNAIEANDSAYFIDFNRDFKLFGDYNVLYRFKNYQSANGAIVGKTNDILSDPRFTDSTLQVLPTSPVINNGASSVLYEFIPDYDINGLGRPQELHWDIGAFEKPD